jgi:septum formation protein
MKRLVLASTSSYRRALLERLGLPFEIANPNVDEAELPGESPARTALRLASAKAQAVAPRFAGALVIGSDQVAALGAMRLDKPLHHEAAVRQLRIACGKAVDFHTAICVLDTASGQEQTRVVPARVHFRRYSDAQIETYLLREQPYDCAGSAKVEGLGIVLIEKIECDDPNALIGLPLIALTEMLAARGVNIL